MNNKIDNRLKVSWCLHLNDGTNIFDQHHEDGLTSEWSLLKDKNLSIKTLGLFATKNKTSDDAYNGVRRPPNEPYYFFAKRTEATFPGSGSRNLFGIGSGKSLDDIEILWYDEGMACIKREVRKIEDKHMKFIIENAGVKNE